MRGANPIDFWRGYALACIYIDHIPNYFSALTMKNFALSSAAELFVFLAGWSLSLATGGPLRPKSLKHVLIKISSRMVTLYVTQLALTVIALAILAAVARGFGDDRFLKLLSAGPVFDQPIKFTLGWVTLAYQLEYFDILPLYVALLAFAAPMVLIARKRLTLAVALSFVLYTLSLIFKLNLPTWPSGGAWKFDPLCWQFLFTLGFVGGELSSSRRLAQLRTRVLWLAVPTVVAGAVVSLIGTSRVSSLYFLFDGTYQTPLRLLNFVALAICFAGTFAVIQRYAPALVATLCSLGRNSLAVFSVGSILVVLVGVLHIEFTFNGVGWSISTAILGLAILIFTAWFAEWPDGTREEVRGVAMSNGALEEDRLRSLQTHQVRER